MQSPAVSRIHKHFFLYVEPLSALVGAYYAMFAPETYLDLTHAPSAPKHGIPTTTSIILAQLANLYFFFAINEALVLRSTEDIKVWFSLLFGLLIADFGHLYSASALGPRIYWDPSAWNPIDWGNIGFVYVGAIMRVAFLYTAWLNNRSSRPSRRSSRIKQPSSKAKR